MTDRLITVPAASMTGAKFFAMVCPKPDPQREVDLAAALAEHQDAIQQTWAIPKLWDQITARDALRAEYRAKVDEFERRYAAQLTECRGDPLLNARAA
ncbi:hypothetical protein [Sphingomonas sp. URHD0057]|uniref:hypothetical protein n=1 Tax=Sphingomonas sp. URHD0057 TaxID=1380389 RepID=UPI000490D787|nr:hypothetical protein [Sphingomonas sp. URHD0057]